MWLDRLETGSEAEGAEGNEEAAAAASGDPEELGDV